MNKLDKHWLSRWLRRMCQPTQRDRDSRRSNAYIKVQPPFLEFGTAEGPMYVSERGVSPSPILVKVKVGNVRWNEARTLEGINSNERVYTAVTTTEGGLEVRFGDGVEGARLPSGADNISATYRTGIGSQGCLRDLVYLNVWERDVSSIEDLEIIERGLITDKDPLGKLIELLALILDLLSEYLDAVGKEAQLDTTRRRTSLRRHRALLKELRSEVGHLTHLLTVLDDRIANIE
ncbi:MAG: hypothetical protein KAJ53_09545 [Anaerolineales bacterium]|nr:hypothetical protein [Anaerolineales bacterium]